MNITITGDAVNGTVIVNPISRLTRAMGTGYSFVSAANTVTINFTKTATAIVSFRNKNI